MDELNFNDIKLEDVTVGGQPVVESVVEPSLEPVAEPAPEPTPEPAPQPEVKQEAPIAPVEPVKAPEVKPESAPAREFKDDFIKGVVEYYEKTGDITPYLQAKLVDFNQMSDEEIMRRELREQYPDVSEKAFDRLFKQQVVDKYKLSTDEWDPEDSELGRELLKSEAAKIRQKYVDWQKNFTAPEPVKDEGQMHEQAKIREALQKFEKSVRENELTKKLLESKRLTIKDGDGEFNFEIPEVEPLVEMTLDNDKFFSQFATGEGQVDFGKWYKTVAYANNQELFEKALINYGKTLGRQEVTKEIKNPSFDKPANDATEYSGDFTSGLLQAFAQKGIHK